MRITNVRTVFHVDEAEARRRMDFADGALGAAGHGVTDPEARELAYRVAAGEISADEAVARTIARIRAS